MRALSPATEIRVLVRLLNVKPTRHDGTNRRAHPRAHRPTPVQGIISTCAGSRITLKTVVDSRHGATSDVSPFTMIQGSHGLPLVQNDSTLRYIVPSGSVNRLTS